MMLFEIRIILMKFFSQSCRDTRVTLDGVFVDRAPAVCIYFECRFRNMSYGIRSNRKKYRIPECTSLSFICFIASGSANECRNNKTV